MSQTTLVTAAGIQAMINAERSGTEKVKLTSIKFGSDIIVPTQYTTDMGTIVAECSAVGGKNIGDQMIHISGADSSTATYDVYTVGVFTDTGILFAISSSDTPIINKSKLAVGAIAFDITLTSASPDVIDFGDSSFTNPPATSENEGVVRIATVDEGIKGENNSVAMTPYTVKKHIESSSAIVHTSGDETIKGKKKFEEDINGNISGNSGTTNKFKTAVKINGTNFDGSEDIRTETWGTKRSLTISDATGKNTSTAVDVDGSTNTSLLLPAGAEFPNGIQGNATSADKLKEGRTITISDGQSGSKEKKGNGISFDGTKNIIIPLPSYIATQLLKDKTKNYGNDYYDDSDITSLIYAGNGSGTVRAELAAGNFERLHPGQYIKGKVTGTTYVVVGCNVYLNRGDTSLTRNHLGLIPIQLVGNSGSLLWSGQKGDTTKNTTQGYAPWNADNENVGKNVTCAYKDSYIAKTVIPKVINNWLKKDFEDQGISVLTFRNLNSTGFDANLPCMSYPSWKGACLYAEWADCKAVLMSEPEVYGGYRWASSPYDSHMQHLQLPIFRQKSIHEIIVADIWLKDIASVSNACSVRWSGYACTGRASYAFRVCPLFLIA